MPSGGWIPPIPPPKRPSKRSATSSPTFLDGASTRRRAPPGARPALAGALFRLSGLPRGAGHERKLLNDALIFLQARLLGASVLTANVRDFDFLSQLAPTGRVIFYRRPSSEP
ncbi:conserved hypothetical protein [Methylocella tundrae]|uniref:Type II toxin-antitoxin system VapC family toxin n=1 Tax=Methylocella tundrae TaxID=227605 RepID=A0A8B6M865_METTU|nr:conserved hypothetical protein [Methylocella tundrae]VTZ51209.1 conserved hypothetical protein [Methylocella tundrae]